jgi:drug/metabolite transporter (DMT)-like permease
MQTVDVSPADVAASQAAGSSELTQQRASAAGQRRWLGLGLVVLAAFCWSTSGLLITATVRGSGISALGLAFWRVSSACLILVVAILVIRPGALRVKRRDLPWLVAMGVLAVGVFQVLWVLAVLINGVSVSTVIQCNAPIIVTLLAWAFWREPLTWRKWVAIGLAFIGTVLVSGLIGAGSIHITPLGLLISLGSALAYAAITLFSKKLTGDYNPFVILAYSFGFAALALLPFQVGRPLPAEISATAIAAFIALLLLTTIAGYAIYMLALRYLPASVASIVAMTEVPFAAFFAYAALGERMSGWQVTGALVVVSGVILLSWPSRRRDPGVGPPGT